MFHFWDFELFRPTLIHVFCMSLMTMFPVTTSRAYGSAVYMTSMAFGHAVVYVSSYCRLYLFLLFSPHLLNGAERWQCWWALVVYVTLQYSE